MGGTIVDGKPGRTRSRGRTRWSGTSPTSGRPEVWTRYSDRGDGIVVANIDTGVQYNHPALVNQYRGNNGGRDLRPQLQLVRPAALVPDPAPCDTFGHGTHTMGTMVGDDGGPNQIGVAPGAQVDRGRRPSRWQRNRRVAAGRPGNGSGPDGPERQQPAARPSSRHRQQLLGHPVRRHGHRGTRPRSTRGSRRGSSRRGPRATRARRAARCVSPAPTRRATRWVRTTSTTTIASFSSRGPSPFSGGHGQAEHRGAGRERAEQRPDQRLRGDVGHVDGHAARGGDGRPHVVGGAGAAGQHRGDREDPVPDGAPRVSNRVRRDMTFNNVWGHGRLDAFAAVRKARGRFGS